MEDLQIIRDRNVVQTTDSFSSFVACRIAAACQNYTRGGLLAPFNFDLAQGSVDRRLEKFAKIGVQSHQDCLRLRVAETNVVFQDLWPVGGQHQPDKKNSVKRKAFLGRTAQGRLNYFADDASERFVVQYCRVGYRAHAARVWTGIVFAHAFVIASR